MGIYEQLGKNIKKLRKQAKLTQEDLADLIKMEPRSIVAIETGNRNPTLRTVFKICEALKVSSSELLPF